MPHKDRAAYREAHRKELAAESRAYYASHREERGTYAATYNAAHKEENAVRGAAWTKANPEKHRAARARRRIRVKIKMTREDRIISVDYRLAIRNDPCFYCGAPGEEDDHYVSLANGGTDHWWNLVRACVHCNRSKQAMDGDEFVALGQD